MGTYYGVETTATYMADSRPWLYGPHGTEPGANPNITLDISAFTPATHYPNGFIPSGTVLGKITATGLYGPYDDAAVDGTQTLAGCCSTLSSRLLTRRRTSGLPCSSTVSCARPSCRSSPGRVPSTRTARSTCRSSTGIKG